MSVTETREVDGLISLVKHHVSKAQLSRQQEAELTFTLPFESMETFPGLASVNLLLRRLSWNTGPYKELQRNVC